MRFIWWLRGLAGAVWAGERIQRGMSPGSRILRAILVGWLKLFLIYGLCLTPILVYVSWRACHVFPWFKYAELFCAICYVPLFYLNRNAKVEIDPSFKVNFINRKTIDAVPLKISLILGALFIVMALILSCGTNEDPVTYVLGMSSSERYALIHKLGEILEVNTIFNELRTNPGRAAFDATASLAILTLVGTLVWSLCAMFWRQVKFMTGAYFTLKPVSMTIVHQLTRSIIENRNPEMKRLGALAQVLEHDPSDEKARMETKKTLQNLIESVSKNEKCDKVRVPVVRELNKKLQQVAA